MQMIVVGIHLHENHDASAQYPKRLNGRMLSYLNQIDSERIISGCRNLSMERIILNPSALDNYFNNEKDRSMLVEFHAFGGVG